MIKVLFLLFIFTILTSCNTCSDSKSDRISFNQPDQDLRVLKKSVLQEGDTIAYRSLSIAFLDNDVTEEFLLYAMIMANKYDYPQAYFDVFNRLTKVFWFDLTKIDEKSAELAIEYLIYAAEKGHSQAKRMVEKYQIESKVNSKEKILEIYRNRLVFLGIKEE